jgi:hypothetical protein
LFRALLVADVHSSSGGEEKRGRRTPNPCFDGDGEVGGLMDREDTASLGLELRSRLLNDSAPPTWRASITVRKRDGTMV